MSWFPSVRSLPLHSFLCDVLERLCGLRNYTWLPLGTRKKRRLDFCFLSCYTCLEYWTDWISLFRIPLQVGERQKEASAKQKRSVTKWRESLLQNPVFICFYICLFILNRRKIYRIEWRNKTELNTIDCVAVCLLKPSWEFVQMFQLYHIFLLPPTTCNIHTKHMPLLENRNLRCCSYLITEPKGRVSAGLPQPVR